jgi:hypothetical protein
MQRVIDMVDLGAQRGEIAGRGWGGGRHCAMWLGRLGPEQIAEAKRAANTGLSLSWLGLARPPTSIRHAHIARG